MGLHLNIPEVYSVDGETREHRKRLWWTAYIFDRMWASKMGHPVSIQDDEIEVERPSSTSSVLYHDDFGDHEYMVASIQLAELAGRMMASIYGRRMQRGSFSQRVQHSLKELTSWVEHLPDHLQTKKELTSSMTPDAVASLHLLFNQVSGIIGCSVTFDTDTNSALFWLPGRCCYTHFAVTLKHLRRTDHLPTLRFQRKHRLL